MSLNPINTLVFSLISPQHSEQMTTHHLQTHWLLNYFNIRYSWFFFFLCTPLLFPSHVSCLCLTEHPSPSLGSRPHESSILFCFSGFWPQLHLVPGTWQVLYENLISDRLQRLKSSKRHRPGLGPSNVWDSVISRNYTFCLLLSEAIMSFCPTGW